MVDRLIRCEGRRRLVVRTEGEKTHIVVWLRDPPRGREIACLSLEPTERDKLLLALTESRSNA